MKFWWSLLKLYSNIILNTLIRNFTHTNQQRNHIMEAKEHHNHVIEASGKDVEILLSPDLGVQRRKGHHI